LKFRFLLIPLFVLIPLFGLPQELKCQVQILTNQIQASDKKVFQTLRNAIYEFMNNRKWTNDQFQQEERIDCSILINITEWNKAENFNATLQVQARRTIFNSSYDSRLINYVDNDIHFFYLENDPLEFSENTYISNLTSLLAYYAYIIIGLDYDTYSMLGGSQYIQKAQNIVNNSQSSGEKGWKSFENKKNRFWMADDMLNQIYRPYRELMYNYHRLGLDKMTEDVNSARSVMLESIEGLQRIHVNQPSSFVLQILFDAKADEIVNIFSEGNQDEKLRIIKILNKIDPAHHNKYSKIIKN